MMSLDEDVLAVPEGYVVPETMRRTPAPPGVHPRSVPDTFAVVLEAAGRIVGAALSPDDTAQAA
jgi:hypothetical protein